MATEELDSLIGSLPGFPLLTLVMKEKALQNSLIPDSFGIWPGNPGYENTYDIYYAAIILIGFLKAQPVVRQASSEGTSTSVDAPDWASLIAWLRSMSPVHGARPGHVLHYVAIPDPPHVVRTDMTGRGDYGDIDTDS